MSEPCARPLYGSLELANAVWANTSATAAEVRAARALNMARSDYTAASRGRQKRYLRFRRQNEADRVLDEPDHLGQELRGGRAIEDAVIDRERHPHHLGHADLAVVHHYGVLDA